MVVYAALPWTFIPGITLMETKPMGALALIQAISTDSAQLATDQATLAALQSTIAADTAAIAADQGNVATDNANLSAYLQTNGAVFVPDPNSTTGGELIYEFSTSAPGFTITPASPAT
jgi:hypothetical protein